MAAHRLTDDEVEDIYIREQAALRRPFQFLRGAALVGVAGFGWLAYRELSGSPPTGSGGALTHALAAAGVAGVAVCIGLAWAAGTMGRFLIDTLADRRTFWARTERLLQDLERRELS